MSDVTLFDTLPVPCAVVNTDGLLVEQANPSFERCFPELVGDDAKSLTGLFSAEETTRVLKAAAHQEPTATEVTTRARRVFRLTFSAYEDKMLVTGVELTEQKKSEYMLESYSSLIEEQNARLYDLAHVDQLTRAHNRRALFKEFERRMLLDLPRCSISVIDIDHFKHYNDVYGHAFGDEVLKIFASHMMQNLGEHDYFARIGGEEFCLVLFCGDKSACYAKVRSMLATLADVVVIAPEAKKVHIAFSAGVAAYGVDGENLDELLNNADKALYHAKATGRNCVVPFSSELYEKRPEISRAKLARGDRRPEQS